MFAPFKVSVPLPDFVKLPAPEIAFAKVTLLPFVLMVPVTPEAIVRLFETSSVTGLEPLSTPKRKVELPVKFRPELAANAELLSNSTVPEAIFKAPVKVFAPERNKVPAPALV